MLIPPLGMAFSPALFSEVVLKVSCMHSLSLCLSPALRSLPSAVFITRLYRSPLWHSSPAFSLILACLPIQTVPSVQPRFSFWLHFLCFVSLMTSIRVRLVSPHGLRLALSYCSPPLLTSLQCFVFHCPENLQFPSNVLHFTLSLALSWMPSPVLLMTCLIKSSSFFKKQLRCLFLLPLHLL